MKLVEDDNQTFGAEDENFESMLEDGNIWDNQTLIEYKAESQGNLLKGIDNKIVKGQLISKGLFCVFNSSQKRTKNFCPSRLGQKFKFSSSFFG